MTTQATQWIQLQGAVNVRDVGGLPTADGHRIRSGVLIRSANLQHLTGADVTRLVRELGVRRVVDLRTDVEVRSDRPGPIHSEPDVVVHHLSLYPDGDGEFEADQALDPAQALTPEPGTGPDQAVTPEPVLPWRREQPVGPHGRTVASYLRYLQRRPDSILAALRAIAEPAGATVVHCAAGKDRTGMVVALALSIAGVDRPVIAADYELSQSRIEAILDQLSRNELYGTAVTRPEQIPPASAEVLLAVFEAIDAEHGGVPAWLGAQGWTGADTERLRAKLVD